ncbi:hypothetical protein T492DRAFT_1041436 [Pavlovales sp. CCMP2436]|nr:hypothetical protein T492DRAFT_1041436 [Pavlovales sp. CCMP2436]|mmetsp:Transcript_50682/g.119085  ORF Transcript_50682/g.119085 Transcript_50682/m.119085 type:complete len:339 (-) Transcript_50682:52-1068(-)
MALGSSSLGSTGSRTSGSRTWAACLAPLLALHGAAGESAQTAGATAARALPPSCLTPCGLRVRYFAFGSNLSEEKLRNRGSNGTTITWTSRLPAVAPGHRLAFNMRMFPPIEPAMASIEPCDGGECEGALLELSLESYDALWRSEGGAMDRPSYQEIVVPVAALRPHSTPADAPPSSESLRREAPVNALTFRAAPWTRLRRDAPPSARYLAIILAGARELGLPSASTTLSSMPSAAPSKLLLAVARAHGVVSLLLSRVGLRKALAPLRTACYALLYCGPSRPLRLLSEVATLTLLAPTATVGVLIRAARRAAGLPDFSFGPPAKKPAPTAAPATAATG